MEQRLGPHRQVAGGDRLVSGDGPKREGDKAVFGQRHLDLDGAVAGPQRLRGEDAGAVDFDLEDDFAAGLGFRMETGPAGEAVEDEVANPSVCPHTGTL